MANRPQDGNAQGLSLAAHAAFALAGAEAEALASAAIGVEHMFLGLCKVESLRDLSAEDAPDLDETQLRTLRDEVRIFLTAATNGGLDVVRARRRLRKLWREAHPGEEEVFWSPHARLPKGVCRSGCALWTVHSTSRL